MPPFAFVLSSVDAQSPFFTFARLIAIISFLVSTSAKDSRHSFSSLLSLHCVCYQRVIGFLFFLSFHLIHLHIPLPFLSFFLSFFLPFFFLP
ncbi:MAG: hypothetical protein J3R72DRAFT_255014 [Linnemannia gamsii]|nr:MAG: hypothetical protein J3R72DRAFT_255014 [Linnemannia gamsii]